VGYYFNLADSVSLSGQEFAWRDLILDILVLPSGKVEILDEEQIPSQLEEGLRAYIESTKKLLLKDHQIIIEEANGMLGKMALRGKRDEIY